MQRPPSKRHETVHRTPLKRLTIHVHRRVSMRRLSFAGRKPPPLSGGFLGARQRRSGPRPRSRYERRSDIFRPHESGGNIFGRCRLPERSGRAGCAPTQGRRQTAAKRRGAFRIRPLPRPASLRGRGAVFNGRIVFVRRDRRRAAASSADRKDPAVRPRCIRPSPYRAADKYRSSRTETAGRDTVLVVRQSVPHTARFIGQRGDGTARQRIPLGIEDFAVEFRPSADADRHVSAIVLFVRHAGPCVRMDETLGTVASAREELLSETVDMSEETPAPDDTAHEGPSAAGKGVCRCKRTGRRATPRGRSPLHVAAGIFSAGRSPTVRAETLRIVVIESDGRGIRRVDESRPPETADRTGPKGILPGQPPPGRQRRDLRGNRRSRRSPSRAARPANRRANGFSRSRAGRTAATPSRMVRTPVHAQAADSRPRRSKSPYFRTPPDVRPARRSRGPKSSANRMAAGRRSGPYGPHGRISTQGDRSPKRPVRRLTANRRTSRRSRTRGGGVRRLLRRLRCAVRATERGYEQERRLQVHIPVIFLISLSLFRASIGVSESMSSPRI